MTVPPRRPGAKPSPIFINVVCHRCSAAGLLANGDNCPRCVGSGFTKGSLHNPVPVTELSITELNLRELRRADSVPQRLAA